MSLVKIRLRAAWDWGGLSIRRLLTLTWNAMDEHNTLDRAAGIAFYAMLSLVPLLGFVFVVALDARVGVANEILDTSDRLLPAEASAIVRDQIKKIQTESRVGLISVSALILLWSSSSLFVSLMDAISAAYGVRDSRPWWRRRLMAVVLTLAVVLLLVLASAMAVIWPRLWGWLGLDHLSWLASASATFAQWIGVVVALLSAFGLTYYFGLDVKKEWQWITPGSVLGVLVLVGASMGFRVYLQFGTGYSETYGALAGVVLLLLWLYLAALALLVGAEVNCVIEQAALQGAARDEQTGSG